jgi:ATP/maltotriose-dependent transcriptional regulator MalT
LWADKLQRGEVGIAREIAEAFRRDAANTGRLTELTVAHRLLGLTCLTQGDLAEAQTNLMQALQIYDPERDREVRFRFGVESGATVTSYLAHVSWLRGAIGRAREMIDDAVTRAAESAHVPTQAYVYYMKAMLEMLRGEANATQRASEALLEISEEHEMARHLAVGGFSSRWARARMEPRSSSFKELW